jgi:hypothetical protein
MHPALFHWLLASAVASVLWYGSFILLKAANHHVRSAVIYAAAAGASVLLAAVLLKATRKLADVGMSLLLMDAVMAGYTLRAAGRLCGSSTWNSLLATLNPIPPRRLLGRNGHAS